MQNFSLKWICIHSVGQLLHPFARMLGVSVLLTLFGADALAEAVQPLVLHKFDGPVDQWIMGGNGRFLIASIPSAKSIVLIDLTTPSRVMKLDALTNQFVIAANRKELVVADTQLFRGTRYLLEDQRLLASNLSFSKEVYWIGMGANSDGPLWACSKRHGQRTPIDAISILNPETMIKAKHLEPTQIQEHHQLMSNDRKILSLNDAVVSDDGSTLVDTYREMLIQIRNKTPWIDLQTRSFGVPSFDGKTLLEHFPPYVTGEVPPATQLSKKRLLRGRCSNLFAAVEDTTDGNLVTAYDLSDFNANQGLPEALGAVLLPLSMPPQSDQAESDSQSSASERSVMEFVPRYNVLARLERNRSRLALYTFALGSSGEQSVDFDAIPTTSYCAASPGAELEYQIPMIAGCRIERFRLILGPEGMRINEKGQLLWHVPKPPTSQECEALVQIVSPSGKTKSHRIILTMDNAVAVNERGRPLVAVMPMPLKHYADMLPDQPSTLAKNINAHQITWLPSKVSHAVVTPDGSYLVLQMPDIESLCVFDVKSGTIVGYLSHQANTFAITPYSILLLYRNPNLVEGWSIPEFIQTDRVPLTNDSPGRLTLQIKRFGNVIQIRQFIPTIDVNDIDVETHFGRSNLKSYIHSTIYAGKTLDLPSREEILKFGIRGHVLMQGEWHALATSAQASKTKGDLVRPDQSAKSIELEQPLSQLLSDDGKNRLIAVNPETGDRIGMINGVFPTVDSTQPSAWLLIDQGYLVQLDSTRRMLLRKPVQLPKEEIY